mgnify:FL=1
MNVVEIPAMIIRGGTTKGIYIRTKDLPSDELQRDAAILSLFGSPDTRQVNGLGGGDPLTSKVALIAISDNPEADIDYRSGEVGIDEAKINYSTMCGNLASGAALYAISSGIVPLSSPVTEVRIRNLNTGKFLKASVPVEGSSVVLQSCHDIDGVQGYGSKIEMSFVAPAGSITGALLPSGNVKDYLQINDQSYECSIVDCGTLYAFFRYSLFGLRGDESPQDLDRNSQFKGTIEALREAVAARVTEQLGRAVLPRQIKMCVLAEPLALAGQNGGVRIEAKVVNRYKTHKAFPVTGAICVSAAVSIPGTLLHLDGCGSGSEQRVHIHHPSGSMWVSAQVAVDGQDVEILNTSVLRSARVLQKGTGYAVLPSKGKS